MQKNVVNLTKHDIVVQRQGAEPIVFPPSGRVARLAEICESTYSIDIVTKDGQHTTVPCCYQIFGEVLDLPEKTNDVIYLVSGAIVEYLRRRWEHTQLCEDWRSDVYAPANFVTDAKGRIVAATTLNCVMRHVTE